MKCDKWMINFHHQKKMLFIIIKHLNNNINEKTSKIMIKTKTRNKIANCKLKCERIAKKIRK